MLVLSRRVGEKVIIGDDIIVTVLEVNDRRLVRLGFDAPREIPVNRSEIYDKIHNKQEESGESAGK